MLGRSVIEKNSWRSRRMVRTFRAIKGQRRSIFGVRTDALWKTEIQCVLLSMCGGCWIGGG